MGDQNKRLRWGLLLVLAVFLLCGGISSVRGWLWSVRRERPLHVNIIDPTIRMTTLWVGPHLVQIDVSELDTTGDEGTALVVVAANDSESLRYVGWYDYDLWMNTPPATYAYDWVDDDWELDLIVHINSYPAERFYISSQDGQPHALP